MSLVLEIVTYFNLVEFVMTLVIYHKLIAIDITYISIFLTKLFDKCVDLTNKRVHLLKHVQLIFVKIINDSQYGDSLVNLIKTVILYNIRIQINIRTFH
jgi:hypothetical protein